MSHLANYLDATDRSMDDPQDKMKKSRNPKRNLHRRDALKSCQFIQGVV